MPERLTGLVGILLAAGRGTRFGGDKLLAALPTGEPMALAAARHLRHGLAPGVPVLAVLRPEQATLGSLLAAEGVQPVFSAEARAGMGRALAAGVGASPRAAGWVVALADMPALRPASIAAVAAALEGGASLAAPVHAGQRGHPVGFAAPWGEALAGLAGDKGARDLLAAAGDRLVPLPTDDPGVLFDVDTPRDLLSLSAAAYP